MWAGKEIILRDLMHLFMQKEIFTARGKNQFFCDHSG